MTNGIDKITIAGLDFSQDTTLNELASLRTEVAQLRSQRDVGNLFYGSSITAISSSGFSVGPLVQDLDSNHNADFNIWIPNYLLSLERLQLRIRPLALLTNNGSDITEGTVSSQLRIVINNIDRTNALGGPWDTAAVLDITQYFASGIGGLAIGNHTIEIKSDTIGSVEVFQDWFIVTRPIS